jgi:hypothetical protein
MTPDMLCLFALLSLVQPVPVRRFLKKSTVVYLGSLGVRPDGSQMTGGHHRTKCFGGTNIYPKMTMTSRYAQNPTFHRLPVLIPLFYC